MMCSVMVSDQDVIFEHQTIWKHSDVDAAGKTFLTWMHEIRHRGTFSKLATAFGTLVQTVKRVKSLSDLPMFWLEVSNSLCNQRRWGR